jgi:hypothetical protein
LACHDDGFIFRGGWLGLDHTADGPSRAREDGTGDAVEAGDVDNAREHDDVLHADVLRGVTAGQSRDHYFGKTNGQSAHGRGRDGGAASAPQGNDAVDFILAGQTSEDNRRTSRHRLDRFTAIPFGGQGSEVHPGSRGHFLAGDMGLNFWGIERARVYQEDLVSALPDLVGHKSVLFAFGVHRAEDCDSAHRSFSLGRSGRGNIHAVFQTVGGILRVFFGGNLELLDFIGAQRPHHFGWHAQHQRTVRDLHALSDEGFRANQALGTYYGPVENHCAHADQGFIADGASMHDGAMPHRHVMPHQARVRVGDMQNGPVLNVGMMPDHDPVDVPA